MADDFVVVESSDLPGASSQPYYQRLNEDEDEDAPFPMARARIRVRTANGNPEDGDTVRDRLSTVRDYLAEPGPDPQWEKMMAVLNVLLDIFWIVSSMAVFHYTDFYVRVLYDRKMDRDWLTYSGIAFALDLAIAGYYILYLTCFRNVKHDDWEKHWRWGFPLATLLFFAGCISFVVASWQVWWIFTPVIIFLFFMGFVTVVSYIPDFSGASDSTVDDLSSTANNTKRSKHFNSHQNTEKEVKLI